MNFLEYSIVVALHHQRFNHPERLPNMHHFFSYDYNWEGIKFPAGIKDWKKFEQKNETVALNILFAPHDGEKWHYIALKSEPTDDGFNRPTKSLSRLFRGITSNHDGDFYCLNCLHSFRTDNALKRHERLCDNNDYCNVEMPTRFNKALKQNYGEK